MNHYSSKLTTVWFKIKHYLQTRMKNLSKPGLRTINWLPCHLRNQNVFSPLVSGAT